MAASLLSVYFVAVVSSFYHELKAPEELKKQKEKSVVLNITEREEDCQVRISEEETVLVTLEQEETLSLPALPRPEEVIPIQSSTQTNNKSTNPFTTDVFKDEKVKLKDNDVKVHADFTPFKKNSKLGDKTPAKMKVFLPGAGGEDDSDFDFSFNDPDFDSSLCAESHDNVEWLRYYIFSDQNILNFATKDCNDCKNEML